MTAETPPPAARPTGPRRVLGSLVVIAVVVAGLFAIGAFQALTACACSQPPTPGAYPPSPVEGVVVAVDSSGLGRVAGFTLRVPGGASFQFELGALENATEFSPSHLAEHMASSQPIRVFFRIEDGRAAAYRLEDAAG
jgi:hypothetical protein